MFRIQLTWCNYLARLYSFSFSQFSSPRSVLKAPVIGVVMELCDRGNVKDTLLDIRDAEKENCPLRTRIRFLREIALGMDYLHRLNVIHRDLKPANVLVDANLSLKLSDFGLSREYIKDAGQSLTKGIGTRLYVAPEMIQGSDTCDNRVDVFSFGITMWCLVTVCFQPYGTPVPFGIEYKVANDANFRPDLGAVREVAPSLEAMIRACWSARPDDRPSFETIVESLGECESVVCGGEEQSELAFV